MMQFLAPMAGSALLGNNNPLAQLLQMPAKAATDVAQQAIGMLLPQGGSSGGISF